MKNLKRRIFSSLIALCMVITMLPMSAFATESGKSLTETESLILEESIQQYSTDYKMQSSVEVGVDNPHILSETDIPYAVNGGNIYFDIATGMITDCDAGVIEAQIPDYIEGVRVTSIGNSAFAGCKIRSIVLPLGLENIYDFAFYNCDSLESVEIPESVEEVGLYAFANCSNLESVIINGGYIVTSAFGNCENLNKIQLGKKYKSGGSETGRAYFINSFTDSNNITNISGYCGENVTWNLTGTMAEGYTITISGTGDTWDFWSYQDSWQVDQPFSYWLQYITKAEVESGIVNLNSGLLRNLKNLKELNISEGIESIGASFCEGCQNLEEVFLPKTIMAVSNSAFKNCSNIRNINLGGLFPINTSAFNDCVNISTASGYAGDVAWTMDVSKSNILLNIYGNGAIKDLGSTYINNTWLFDCPSFKDKLVDIIIGEGVSHIGVRTFEDCTNVKNISFSDSVTSIGESAFANCSSLTELVLPNSINSVGDDAFSNCSSLTEVVIPGSVNVLGEYAFSGCTNLTSVMIENGVTVIGESAFDDCDKLINIDIPDSVTQIGEGVFRNCGSLFKITIPGSISCIEYGAFSNCKRLSQIVIQDGTSSISGCAFEGCSSLSSIIIPKSVTQIGTFAFDSCNALDNIYYAGSKEEWEKISVSVGNDALEAATIHYNSTEADIPDDYNKNSYVAGILKSYDSQEQKIYFEYYDGVTSVYEYKITDQNVVEDWDILIGKPVLVSYIPGEYGTDTLSRYVMAVQLAEPIIGNVDTITESTITLDGKVFDINLDSLIGLEYYIGETVACYVINDVIVDMKGLKKETGMLNAGSNTSVTIDGVQYAAIFNGIPPYLPAPELWFEHEVEYYFYNDGVNQIIYKISLKSYSSTFTAKLTKWEGNTVTFEDDTIRQVAEDVAFDSTLIGKWVDYTVETTADGGNVISSIILAKPTYKTEVKKLVAWNDGNPQFSDGTTMGVFIIGDQYDPIMIGRWVKLNIEDDLNTGTRIKGISLVEPSSKGDFKLLQSTDIYLKNNQYSFDGQNYEDSSKFEIEFKISIQNIVEGVKDTILSEMKTDANMNLTVEDIQVIEPNGFNFDWFGLGEIGDVKGLEIQAGEIREVTGFIRPDMLYFVDEKEVTETISCKIVLTNGDIFEKDLLFTIHNLDYEEPSTGGDGEDGEEEDIEFTSWEKGLLSEFYKAKDIDVTMQSGKYSLSKYFEDDVVEDICKTVSVWAGILKTDFAEETKGTLPTYLKIQATMNSDNDKHEATIFFKYNNFYSTSYASLDYISYALVDNETNRKFVSNSLFSASTSASFRNFADGVNAYLTEKYGEEAKDFCKKISKQAIEDVTNMTAVQYVGTMLKLLTEFEELAGHIDQIQNILENPLKVEISSLKEFNDVAAKCAFIGCPVDVWVYNKDNVLCGKIENNSITYDTHEVFMYVENDEKTVWFSDDIHFELISTDTGSMNYDITEYEDGKASRRVEFQNVPLQIGVSYTTDVPVKNGLPADAYVLTSNNGTKVEASEDVDLTEDDVKPEITPVTGVTLNMQSIKFNQIDKTEQLIANITPNNATDKSVTWVSSNPSVATVDNTGLVTALANGTTTITVKTVDGGYTANCTVTVDIKSTSNNDGSNGSSSNSSGGVSVTPTSYTISISDTDGGTIAISSKTASKDKTVTITAVPDEGYKLDNLSVSDKNGNQIELTKKTNTEYTFKMPASKVTVNAKFSKIIVDPEPSSMPFTDVSENAWYYNAVKYIYENGMMQGISDTEFAPNLSMNRAMIVTVLHRLENTPETTITNQFLDVESNQWYTEAVQWAFENDIVNGYSSDKFAPMDNVTREQLAVILYNYTNYKGGNTDIVDDLTAFKDADDISDWSKNAISWAVGSGLLSGKGNGILDPKGTATRAEVTQILMNFTK